MALLPPSSATARVDTPPDPAAADLAVIARTRHLDDTAAAQLLRWCAARLHQADVGQAKVLHLVVDVTQTRRTSPAATTIPYQGRRESERRQVGITSSTRTR